MKTGDAAAACGAARICPIPPLPNGKLPVFERNRMLLCWLGSNEGSGWCSGAVAWANHLRMSGLPRRPTSDTGPGSSRACAYLGSAAISLIDTVAEPSGLFALEGALHAGTACDAGEQRDDALLGHVQAVEAIEEVEVVVAPKPSIQRCIDRHYGQSETESVDSMIAEFTDTHKA